ncbi:hypothetical protein [Catenuloplanes japonicus]|uniref:hypothetical protein n=1 Tax=Catenuloplanes japonicus TaxID=33876 RepID=UPI0005261D1C|nr:hypothetical protein [Catenuloplanes japonicus]
MIRPTWTPATAEQRNAVQRAAALAEQKIRIEAEMWAAIKEARDLDVPDTVLCEQTGQSRATLNRKYGSRSTQAGATEA